MTAIRLLRAVVTSFSTALLTATLLFSVASHAEDKAATEAQLKQLRSRIETLRGQQEQRRRSESAARAELADIETRMGLTSRALKSTRTELATARERLNNLNQERTTYRNQRDRAAKALKHQLRAAFMSGGQEYLKLLLNQQDPARFGRTMSYYNYLNRARGEQLKTLAWAMGRLVGIEEKITAEIQSLRTLESAVCLIEPQQLEKAVGARVFEGSHARRLLDGAR